MNLTACVREGRPILMEGALGERLKREYRLAPDEDTALAAMIESEKGRTALKELWGQYLDIAKRWQLPFLATTPTRRANRERVARAGRTSSVIADNVRFLKEIREESGVQMFLGGLMGCKGDAYTGECALTQAEAREFHGWQADLFAQNEVDYLFAGIMPTLPEAAGMAQAMADTGIPYIISFTVRGNGKLIDGTPISDAIRLIDNAANEKPLCYMANCVHPSVLFAALSQPFNQNELVRSRFLGLQANTSPLPYE